LAYISLKDTLCLFSTLFLFTEKILASYANMKKRVCIVGAGPAGLVAAKTLQTGHFTVTVYEKNDRTGGIWALDEETKDGYLDPKTPTNLSRFTVGFSDLNWKDVDLQSERDSTTANGIPKARDVPMFPKAWQANRYLEEYQRRYILDGVIKLGTKVIKATRHDHVNMEDLSFRWTVETEDSASACENAGFDYLIVASGFFATPRWPKHDESGLANGNSTPPVKTLHSSQFRTLSQVFPDSASANGKTILLIGGGNSAGETAAAVAMQLSDAAWSPNTSRRDLYRGCKVVHITPRPIYGLPPYHEYEKGSLTYVPIDFKLYDFARRPVGMDSYAGQQTMEVRDIVHNALQTMVGGDQSDFGSEALRSPAKGDGRGTVYVALSESYTEFVRSGLIDVRAGRVTGVDCAMPDSATATVESGGERMIIDDIGAVSWTYELDPWLLGSSESLKVFPWQAPLLRRCVDPTPR